MPTNRIFSSSLVLFFHFDTFDGLVIEYNPRMNIIFLVF